MGGKINLKNMDLAELEQFIVELGEPKYRARQIAQWVFEKGVTTIDRMTNLGKSLKDKLQQVATIENLQIAAKQVSANDGTTKYLFQLPDGQAVETVFMVYSFGNSVCVSSQVGCQMGCRFCASTIGGKVRNLTGGEIYDQVLKAQLDQGKRVRSVVIMGSGEPMDNYENVLKFIRLLNAEYGLNIGSRHITLSTCGVVPGIKRLATENIPLTLSISLHAPNDEMRNQIMPVNKKYPLASLMDACREYIYITNRRITFEYSLISGFNDSIDCARELARLLKGVLGHVNLIPVNPVTETNFQKPTSGQIKNFAHILEGEGIAVTVRRELGSDIDAACGQLRRRYMGTVSNEVQ